MSCPGSKAGALPPKWGAEGEALGLEVSAWGYLEETSIQAQGLSRRAVAPTSTGSVCLLVPRTCGPGEGVVGLASPASSPGTHACVPLVSRGWSCCWISGILAAYNVSGVCF